MERLYRLKSAADLLDISVRTLRRIIERENIEVTQVGTRIRLSESQVKSMIKPQKSAKTVVDEMFN